MTEKGTQQKKNESAHQKPQRRKKDRIVSGCAALYNTKSGSKIKRKQLCGRPSLDSDIGLKENVLQDIVTEENKSGESFCMERQHSHAKLKETRWGRCRNPACRAAMTVRETRKGPILICSRSSKKERPCSWTRPIDSLALYDLLPEKIKNLLFSQCEFEIVKRHL